MDRRATWLACAALAGLACAGQGGFAPRPTAVEPGSGYAGADTRVVIRGEGFAVLAQQPAAGGAPEVDARYRAWLGEAELQAVTWVDAQTLHATVPAGLPSGSHALEVEGPFGRRGRLERAFTVASSPGGALQVAVVAGRATVSVGQEFPVTATAVNSGYAEVRSVAPDSLQVQPGGGASVVAGPVPASVASVRPGESASFAWTLSPSAPGVLDLGASVSGIDSFSGETVRSSAPSQARVQVQRPPQLSAVVVAPGSVATGTSFSVSMLVANAGEAAALAVAPGALALVPGSVPAAPSFGPFPGEADVAPGGTATFSWTWVAGDAVGSLRLTGGASGLDGNAGTPVSAPPATSGDVVVGRAALRAVLEAVPATVGIGDPVTVTLRLENPGTAPVVSIHPEAPVVSGTGRVEPAPAGPVPPSIPTLAPGESGAFTWTFTASAPGQLGFSAGATGIDGFSGAPLGASASLQNAVTVAPPPTLVATAFTASPTAVGPGEPVSLALTLSNATGAAVDVVSVVPSVEPAEGSACTAPAPPAPLRIAAGASAAFAWTCTAGSSGVHLLGAAVSAVQAVTGASVGLVVPGTPVTVGVARLAVASFTASHAVVSTGQPVALALVLQNASSAAETVTALTPTVSPSAGVACTAAAPAPPQPVAAGTALAFSWSCTAGAAGARSFSALVSARDASGADASPAVGTVEVSVEAAAVLEVASFGVVPSTVARNDPATVTLSLRNTGGAAARVTGVVPTITPSARTRCTAPVPAPPQVVPGGATLSFSWTCSANTRQTFELGATVVAADVNSGASVGPVVTAVPLIVR